MKQMNILLIGSGGREHALAHKLSKSPLCGRLYIAPGNPGTEELGTNIEVDINNHLAIADIIDTYGLDTVVIGPEVPLVDGVVDFLETHHDHLTIIGPKAEGAKLEGSKAFAKEFMLRHRIPTAAYFECTSSNLDAGIEFLEAMSGPYVLKADGLAAGKGVLIIDDLTEAKVVLQEMIEGKFGNASATVVIEEFLAGIEYSVFVLTDGKDYVLLPEAKDYKRIGEGDTGLNTGGMGAVSPVPFFEGKLREDTIEQIIEPTIKGLAADNIDYVGFIFFGLINVNGRPYVIEYNCRMGDPETEVVLPRIQSDLCEAFLLLKEHRLSEYEITFSPNIAATVILVSEGYPEAYTKGLPISELHMHGKSTIYHAGTKKIEEEIVTNGGRVLAITSMGATIAEAVNQSLDVAASIQYKGKYYRKDIGLDLM